MPILKLSPILLPTELLRVFVPTMILLMDVCTSFCPMVPQDPSCCPMILGFEIVVCVSKLLGIPFYLCMLKQHRWLRLRNLAVMCNAAEPCSVNTAQDPESSFTASPPNTTRPSCTCGISCPLRNFRKCQKSMSVAKGTVLPSFCASSISSCLSLTLDSCQDGKFFNLSHSLSTATFASGMRIAFGIGIGRWTTL